MTYRHRRLRPNPGPRWVLTATVPVSAETAQHVKRVWRAAGRRQEPLVVDGTRFTVQALR